jgi:hypothetical protein
MIKSSYKLVPRSCDILNVDIDTITQAYPIEYIVAEDLYMVMNEIIKKIKEYFFPDKEHGE